MTMKTNSEGQTAEVEASAKAWESREAEVERFCKLNAVIAKALSGMKPPKKLSVSDWSDKNRRLSPEASAETGQWRTSRTPYLKEPMDAFCDPKIRRIVIVSSSQVGKSEAINNMIGFAIDQDPGSILFIHPTTVDAKEYSKLRIAPMFRDCRVLKSKISAPKSRTSNNTVLQKSYPGGILTLCGSTEAHALCSKPIRYIFGDERDRWAVSAGKEGDPWKLAMARQITFYNAKAVEVSTPTIKNHSAIADSYSEGTMEKWCVQCPHCGEYHDIQFKDIHFDKEETVVNQKKHYKITSIYYICPNCSCISDESTMKRQPAKWIAENPSAYEKGIRSFWLNSFVSPWASWESSISEYLLALGNSAKMQVVYNTRFGMLWEERGNIESEETILARREEYNAELPEGVLLLTCGVDTQDDRLEYEVVGHGHFGETWGIKKGIIMGRPDTNETWQALDDVIDHIYRFKNGIGLKISITFIDEGGHFTQDVRLRCSERFRKKVFPIKGLFGDGIPYTAPPKKQKIVINGRYIGQCWWYGIGVDSGKQIIMDNLKVRSAGNKYCHFPLRDDYNITYFQGLLSERLVYKDGRKHPWQWEKIPGHERNEALDCRNYALAAAKALAPDYDAIERRLKGTVNKPKKKISETTEKLLKPKEKNKRIQKFYDEW